MVFTSQVSDSLCPNIPTFEMFRAVKFKPPSTTEMDGWSSHGMVETGTELKKNLKKQQKKQTQLS